MSVLGATNRPMKLPDFRSPKAFITKITMLWTERDRSFAGRHVCTPPVCRTCGLTNGENKL